MDRNGVFRLGCFLKPQVPKSTRIMTNVQYWPRITSSTLQWHHALGNIQILYSCSHIYWLKIHLMLVKLSTPSFCWSLLIFYPQYETPKRAQTIMVSSPSMASASCWDWPPAVNRPGPASKTRTMCGWSRDFNMFTWKGGGTPTSAHIQVFGSSECHYFSSFVDIVVWSTFFGVTSLRNWAR